MRSMTEWAVAGEGNRKGAESGASTACSSDPSTDFFFAPEDDDEEEDDNVDDDDDDNDDDDEEEEKGVSACAIFIAEMLHDLDKNSMGS
jgi:hypothetical protein